MDNNYSSFESTIILNYSANTHNPIHILVQRYKLIGSLQNGKILYYSNGEEVEVIVGGDFTVTPNKQTVIASIPYYYAPTMHTTHPGHNSTLNLRCTILNNGNILSDNHGNVSTITIRSLFHYKIKD